MSTLMILLDQQAGEHGYTELGCKGKKERGRPCHFVTLLQAKRRSAPFCPLVVRCGCASGSSQLGKQNLSYF